VPTLRATLGRLLGDEDVRSISRRYFVSNGFDGTLTCIGVVVGAVLSGVPDGVTVVKIGPDAAVGLGTSAVWSVWEIERAETRAEILRIEQTMLVDLDDTRVKRDRQVERLPFKAGRDIDDQPMGIQAPHQRLRCSR